MVSDFGGNGISRRVEVHDLLSCQRDIDHPLMRVSGRPTCGCPTESDRSCRPFPKGLVALYRSIDVPVLVVHGTEDRILPYESTAARLPALLDDVELVPIAGGPHNIAWTHPDEVNKALLEFVDARVAA